MRIGDYEITALSTGRFGLDGGAMFGVIPKPLWSRFTQPDDRNRITLGTRVLLIQGLGKNILIDTGMGDKWSEKHRDIYRINADDGGLLHSLQEKGLGREDITDVVLTHLHFDHAGGTTMEENGILVPTFPEATHYIQRENWKWAVNPTEKDTGSYRRENFAPLSEYQVLEFVEGEEELLPGIRMLVTNGHTRAHQHPFIRDAETRLFFCGDLIPTRAHLVIPWVMGYDNFPLSTLEEKKTILDRAVEEDWILCLEHDPETCAFTVKRTDEGYEIDSMLTI